MRQKAIEEQEALELPRRQFVQNFLDNVDSWVQKLVKDVIEVAELQAGSLNDSDCHTW